MRGRKSLGMGPLTQEGLLQDRTPGADALLEGGDLGLQVSNQLLPSLATGAGALQNSNLALQDRADVTSSGLGLGMGLSAQLRFEGNIAGLQNGAVVADPRRH
jgi:hypothetical protein